MASKRIELKSRGLHGGIWPHHSGFRGITDGVNFSSVKAFKRSIQSAIFLPHFKSISTYLGEVIMCVACFCLQVFLLSKCY